ncbi:flagellar protein FlgN [Variovorax sp.]|uniref:flagella synthesis protein FlgN n=1 Tax=Variovorax sp. TaxID=1871043 RepID=UPI002D74A083|nr:flagellar protein FlgN [Variovorax sp.]HYP85648.1 flagellar protein FlgN [Variovorax sp.]
MNAAFLACLQAQLGCMETLRELLAREQEAMAQSRFTQLMDIGARKEELLERLSGLDSRREAAQQAAGFEPGRAGAEAAAIAGGDVTRKAWSDLLALAARARDENMRNGATVWAHLEFTQRALNFLQSSAQMFYGPDGARRSTSVGGGTRLAAG